MVAIPDMAELVAIEPALFREDEAWFIFSDGRKCLRKREPRAEPARSHLGFPSIRRDTIDPIRGADGRMHDSLSSYRRSLEPSGNPRGERFIELGNENLPTIEHKVDRKQRRDDIRAAMSDVRNGNVPKPVILEE